MTKRKALFLDRDGTLIHDAHYLKDPEKVEIIEGISESIKLVREQGFLLFMHTNQSGIARGYFDSSDVNACNKRMHRIFDWPDDFFSEICIAPESPDELGGYRKPSPKFEEEMVEKYNLDSKECWVVGDRWSDPQTGLNAGMNGALVETGKPIDQDLQNVAKDNGVPIYPDIAEFINSEILAK